MFFRAMMAFTLTLGAGQALVTMLQGGNGPANATWMPFTLLLAVGVTVWQVIQGLRAKHVLADEAMHREQFMGAPYQSEPVSREDW